MKVTKYLVGALAASMLFASCSDDDDASPSNGGGTDTIVPVVPVDPVVPVEPVVVVPDAYDASGYAPATQNVTDQVGALSSLLKKADGSKDPASVVSFTYEELKAEYESGSPAVKDAASSLYNTLIAGSSTSGVFEAAASASEARKSGADYVFKSSSADNSGKAGNHLLIAGGMEPEQVVEKGSFGGVAFNHVTNVLFASPSAVTKEQLDQALALYGSDPTFETKKYSAKYTAKDHHAKKYHDLISYQFRKAQQAIAVGNTTELGNAVGEIEMLWEEGVISQAIYYFNDVKAALGTDLDVAAGGAGYDAAADALHAHSEAIGMLMGFYFLGGDNASALGEALTFAGANTADGSLNADQFVNDATKLGDVDKAISALKIAYGL
jgi:hypothetical protein